MPKATFDASPPEGAINFGIGQPSDDLLPVALYQQAMDAFLETAAPRDFNYGDRQGDPRFRASLAAFLEQHHGTPVAAEALFLTNGNSHALDFVCHRFTRPGDTVFVEEPSYFLAFQVFRDHRLDIVGIPVDQGGMSIDHLEAALERVTPALVYTIPSYNNPSGACMDERRRRRLVELSAQHGFLVAADEVYQLLGYFGATPPALGTLAEQGRILSMGSFSKILAPGLRLGWIQAGPELMTQMLESGWVNSGGSVNHVTSHIVRAAMDTGLQTGHLERLRDAYRGRLLAMESALQQELADLARWRRPDGGYFFWLEMNGIRDTNDLRPPALAAGSGFIPGPLFTANGGLKRHLRLSFAHYGEPEIERGIRRLADVLREGA